MLSSTKRYFVALMSAFIRQEVPPAPQKTDWLELYGVARKQNLSGVVYFMVNQLEPAHQPPADIKNRLEQECMATIYHSATLDYETGLIWKAFNEKGISHFPLKGYEIKAYWPQPDLRTMRDIDYVIRPQDRELSQDVLTALGYELLDMDHVWVYKKAGILLEEHHQIEYFDRITYSMRFLGDSWENAAPVNGHTYSLTPEYHAVYLLAHLVKHLIKSGCGIRQVMDVAFYFQHFRHQLNWDQLWERLDAMRLTEFTKVLLSYCHYVLQADVCAEGWLTNTPGTFERFSETLLAEGVFGDWVSLMKENIFENHRQGKRAAKVWRDIKTVWAFFFPSFAKMCNSHRYRYVRAKPWLLPFAYLHRGWHSVFGKEKRLKIMINMLKGSYRALEGRQDMYQQIGLGD